MIRATLKNGVTYDENFGITLLVIRNETIKNKSNKDAPFFLDTLKNQTIESSESLVYYLPDYFDEDGDKVSIMYDLGEASDFV